jgi:hypothetical protein
MPCYPGDFPKMKTKPPLNRDFAIP